MRQPFPVTRFSRLLAPLVCGALSMLAWPSQAAEANAFAGQPGTAAIDSAPPVLTSLDFSGSVNAQTADPSFDAQVKMTDNLAGVVYYALEIRSPSGSHTIIRDKTLTAPSTSINGKITVGLSPYARPFSRFSEPGTWVAKSFYARDANNNEISYNEAQLAGIPGNHQVSVSNNGGHDIVAPVFEQGTILTPTVRLSRPPAGTSAGTPPYVSADLSITDTGNGAVSGAYFVKLTMCRANASNVCLDTMELTAVTNRAFLAANTMRVGAQLRTNQMVGSYKVYSVYVEDVAGNGSESIDVDFGGDTDLSDLFSSGSTIFVNS